jgi:DNA-binding MarR family transcriptional regulator
VGELVQLLGHRPSTLTTILDRLSDRRLIVRQVRPDDRRSFLVLLTERGQEEALRSERAVARAEQAVLDSLDADTAAAVRSALGG